MSSSLPNTTKDKDYIAISINSSVSYPPSAKLYCNLCSCNLVLLDAQKEEWYCNRCSISYYPNKGEKVKRANKFSTPGGETDKHGNIIGDKMPIMSMVDDNPKLSSTYGKPRLPKYLGNAKTRTENNKLYYNRRRIKLGE